MSFKDKRKTKKDGKKKLPFRRVISNNLFRLGIERRAAPFTVLSMVIVSVFQALANFISGSYLLRFALNGISEGKSFGEIATVIVIGLTAVVSVYGVSQWYFLKTYRVRMTKIKQYIFDMAYKKAASVELACYEDPKYYDELAKAIEECGSRTESVNNSIDMMVYRIVNFSANFMLLVVIDPMLLLFVLIPLIAIPIQTKLNKIRYDKNMELTEENRRKEYARRTFYLADYSKEMRLLDMPVLMLKRFKECGENVMKIIKRYGLRTATFSYIMTECNDVLAGLGAMLYSVWQTLEVGKMSYGDCIVVVNSIESVSYALTNSADTLLKFHENALYIENLRKFLDHEITLTGGDTPLPADGDIALNNVSFRYVGAEDYTLKNVSMRFGKNQKVAIVGHNGAGKTTLVKLLLRLYDAEGVISYGGTDIKDFPLQEYRDIFSSVMQDYHVFSLTAAENVLLRPMVKGDREIATTALEKSGLGEKVGGFAHGIDTVMTKEFDKDGEVLSGGEAQKLAISHVYSRQNRFVILDEPSSALDPIAEHQMYEKMTDACADCGMIFISHRLSSAVMADMIYLMENGTVTEHGTHAELMAANGRYADMFRRQAENYAEV